MAIWASDIHNLGSSGVKPSFRWNMYKYMMNCTVQISSCLQEEINSGLPALCSWSHEFVLPLRCTISNEVNSSLKLFQVSGVCLCWSIPTFRNSRSVTVSIGPGKEEGVSLHEAHHGHQMQHGQHLVPRICHGCLLQLRNTPLWSFQKDLHRCI